jgi:tRNA pseudouridine38-40 synthase
VHARGQVAHVDLERNWDERKLFKALTVHLPADLSCRAVARVSDVWHAVHEVRDKTYSYTVDVGADIDPFHAARFAWRPPFALELSALQHAAKAVAARRDWSAFRRRNDHRDDTTCEVKSCTWRRSGRFLVCSITASGFIYRLARSLVGGMVLRARGACGEDDWLRSLSGEIGESSRQQAPACGLSLERIVYKKRPHWMIPANLGEA